MFKKEIKKLLAVPMVCIMLFAVTVPSFAAEKNDAFDTATDGDEGDDIDGIEILNRSEYEDDSKIVASTEIAIDFSDFDSVEEFQAALRESLGDYDANETAAYSSEAIRGTRTLNDKSAIKNINKILDLVLFNCCNKTQPNITSE